MAKLKYDWHICKRSIRTGYVPVAVKKGAKPPANAVTTIGKEDVTGPYPSEAAADAAINAAIGLNNVQAKGLGSTITQLLRRFKK